MAEESKDVKKENDLSLENLMKQRDNELAKEAEEDEKILSDDSDDDEKPKIQQVILDDGSLDFDIKDGINFKPGKECVEHFGELKPEDIDKFGENTKNCYELILAHNVYCKSIVDQITQKGLNTDTTYWKQEPTIFEKLVEFSRFEFLLSLTSISQESKNAILAREIDKKFAKAQDNSQRNQQDTNIANLADSINSLNKFLRKKG